MLLADLTTLRVGGPVRDLVTCTTEEQLVAEGAAGFVLGGGSNVVMPDEGLDRVVLVRTRGVTDDLVVQAGEDWDAFVAGTLDRGYVGLEALSGIPGTVGAAPIQNIGAYGAEVAGVVRWVRVLDRRTGVVGQLADCGFAYRDSVFKREGHWVVLAVAFDLERGELSAPVRYAELAARLGVELGARASALDVREAVLALRRGKGMVLSDDPDSVSAGSFFTNPLVPVAPDGAPSWPDPSGLVKVSAAWLIESAGFPKGYGDGRVGLSTKHTLAVVNRGGATAAELTAFAAHVAAGVQERFGIALVPEPVVVPASVPGP